MGVSRSALITSGAILAGTVPAAAIAGRIPQVPRERRDDATGLVAGMGTAAALSLLKPSAPSAAQGVTHHLGRFALAGAVGTAVSLGALQLVPKSHHDQATAAIAGMGIVGLAVASRHPLTVGPIAAGWVLSDFAALGIDAAMRRDAH